MLSKTFAHSSIGAFHRISNRHLASASGDPLRSRATESWPTMSCAKVWNRAREIGYPYGTIVLLLILTGQRLGEIAGLRWEWIEEGTVTFPSEITKNARASKIPLGMVARRIIDRTPRPSLLLFPARG